MANENARRRAAKRPNEPAAFRTGKWSLGIAVAAVVVGTVATLGQIRHHDFVDYDDDVHLWDNPHLNPLTLAGLAELWRRPYFGEYVPVTYSLFGVESYLSADEESSAGAGDSTSRRSGRFDPRVFHVGGLALHVAAALMVLLILRSLVKNDLAACAGALLFALHPLQVESVAWVSETRGVLAGLFGLSSIWLYLKFAGRTVQSGGGATLSDTESTADKSIPTSAHSTRSAWSGVIVYSLATVAFTLSLLSKPSAVAIPLILAVIDYGWLRRPVVRIASSLGLWIAMSVALIYVTRGEQPADMLRHPTPLYTRPLVAGDSLAFYLWRFAVPTGLTTDYGLSPRIMLAHRWGYLGWVVPLALLTSLSLLPHRRVWLTGAGIFVAALVPVLGLIPFGYQDISTVADRYCYLALLGPAFALAWILARFARAYVFAICAVWLAVLAGLSFQQARHWKDNESLIAHTLDENPDSFVFHCRRGGRLRKEAISLRRQGKDQKAAERFAAAKEHYRTAMRADPKFAVAYNELGVIFQLEGNGDAAIENFRRAIALDPTLPDTYHNLANIYMKRGDEGTAIELYRDALAADPKYVRGLKNLAILLAKDGQIAAAIEHLQNAVAAAPSDGQARAYLGWYLARDGKLDRGRAFLEEAAVLRPRDAEVHYYLGIVSGQMGDVPKARQHLREALALKPNYPQAQGALNALERAAP